MKVLCALPEMEERYAAQAKEVFRTAPQDIASDFPAQARVLGLITVRFGQASVLIARH